MKILRFVLSLVDIAVCYLVISFSNNKKLYAILPVFLILVILANLQKMRLKYKWICYLYSGLRISYWGLVLYSGIGNVMKMNQSFGLFDWFMTILLALNILASYYYIPRETTTTEDTIKVDTTKKEQ
eukprot:TRINITY_DN3214_c0_g1_i3.p1 TRINITY_DN3214_c0_g1~~TRINITY_DN3214_c0_g1_i3.p1  ORF type:complete len:127 (-),score=16.77 TRINITY_DN3214_c0_g1_i3:96-476(-)